jgi:probable O-glycosylation ligase (exosortase A-associated)
VPLIRPADGIGLYMLLAAVRPQNITYGLDVAGGRYSIVTLGCIFVGWALRMATLKPRWGAFHLVLPVFVLQLLVSRIFALDDFAAKSQFMMMFIPILFAIVIAQVVRTEEQVSRVLWFLAIGLGFLGYWAFWKYHFTNYYNLENDGEIVGPGGMLIDRNDFGLGLNMGLPLIFFCGLSAKRWWAKALTILSAGPSAIVVLETGSRGAFLGLAAVGSYILYKMHHKRWVLALAVVAMIGGLMVIPPEYLERLAGITTAAQEDTSAQGRLVSWAAAIEMARQRPLTGVGLGCFTVDYFSYAPDAEEAFVAHNSFFQILGTAGIPAAILWVLLIVRMWQVLSRCERRLRSARMKGSRLHSMVLALKTSLIAYTITGFFLSMEDLEFFYYELGLTAALDLAVRAELARIKAEEDTRERAELIARQTAQVAEPDPGFIGAR